jgi:prolipoprotein diacylglyceryltransferase
VTFPVYFHLFGLTLHPHMVMEALAYAAGLGFHLGLKARVQRARGPAAAAELERGLWVVAGAILGALLGAKLLVWAEHWRVLTGPAPAGGLFPSLERWVGGKTIVGGLAGGWAGVELAKRLTGVRGRTGDTWVYPLAISMAIGRVGCFLTGLADDTYGTATDLLWGVDFGDGVSRHPTQLYEIGVLLVLAGGLAAYQRAARLGFGTGRLFRLFMIGYGVWRFGAEFIKPTDKPFLGISAIQVASLGLAVAAGVSLARERRCPAAGAAEGVSPG